MRALVLLMALGLPAQAEVIDAKGAQLRVLDKLSGVVTDYDLAVGQVQTDGRLSVQLDDCRYPSDLPTGEAFAHLTIGDAQAKALVFQGWMVASSPALSALDHPRYDVWVLRCDVPEDALPKPEDSTGEAGPDASNP